MVHPQGHLEVRAALWYILCATATVANYCDTSIFALRHFEMTGHSYDWACHFGTDDRIRRAPRTQPTTNREEPWKNQVFFWASKDLGVLKFRTRFGHREGTILQFESRNLQTFRAKFAIRSGAPSTFRPGLEWTLFVHAFDCFFGCTADRIDGVFLSLHVLL